MLKTRYFLLGSIIFASQMYGWGHSPSSSDADNQNVVIESFPLNADQQWYTTETYLIWKPYIDGLDYAHRFSIKSDGEQLRLKINKPDFEWSSGVRLAVGRYLPHHQLWDVNLVTTYYYSDLANSTGANRDQDSLLSSSWMPISNGGTTKGNVNWRLNFFTWDLFVGRQISWTENLVAHPFLGLRAALIYQQYQCRFSDQFTTVDLSTTIKNKFKGNDDFWGIGPRIGSDFTFYFKPHWAFLGTFASTIFLGQYSAKEKISMNQLANDPKATNTETYNATDEAYTVRVNLEGKLGMGWETWVKNNSVRIAPSFVFEASEWLDMNSLFHMGSSTTADPDIGARKSYGNLGLLGFNLNLQIDF